MKTLLTATEWKNSYGRVKMATKPCTDCKHCQSKQGVAGGYWCGKKKMLTSIARITDEHGHPSAEDCFEPKEDISGEEK